MCPPPKRGGARLEFSCLVVFAYSAGPLQTGAPASLLCAKMMASSLGEVQVLRREKFEGCSEWRHRTTPWTLAPRCPRKLWQPSTRLPRSKCDASSVFAATELKVADGVRCLSIVRAFSLPGGVVDDGFGGIRRRRPRGVLRVDSVVLVLPAPKSDTCRWRRTAALALWFSYASGYRPATKQGASSVRKGSCSGLLLQPRGLLPPS